MDHAFERGGDEDLDVELDQLLVADRLRPRVADDGLEAFTDGAQHAGRVEPVAVERAALHVGDGDDLAPGVVEILRGQPADLAEPLHGDPALTRVDTRLLQRRERRVHDAAAGRAAAPL